MTIQAGIGEVVVRQHPLSTHCANHSRSIAVQLHNGDAIPSYVVRPVHVEDAPEVTIARGLENARTMQVSLESPAGTNYYRALHLDVLDMLSSIYFTASGPHPALNNPRCSAQCTADLLQALPTPSDDASNAQRSCQAYHKSAHMPGCTPMPK